MFFLDYYFLLAPSCLSYITPEPGRYFIEKRMNNSLTCFFRSILQRFEVGRKQNDLFNTQQPFSYSITQNRVVASFSSNLADYSSGI